jgi:hypothetical protein
MKQRGRAQRRCYSAEAGDRRRNRASRPRLCTRAIACPSATLQAMRPATACPSRSSWPQIWGARLPARRPLAGRRPGSKSPAATSLLH